jgi:hypothetical protein
MAPKYLENVCKLAHLSGTEVTYNTGKFTDTKCCQRRYTNKQKILSQFKFNLNIHRLTIQKMF